MLPTPSSPKIHAFTDLRAWQEAHKLVLSIYTVTKNFPSDERFGLIDQLRRAAVSITSNIAEGFRRRTAKEKRQFYTVSLSSLNEVESQILTAKDLGYADQGMFQAILIHINNVGELLGGLIKSAQTFNR